jgi:Flp pilus assembly protein TadB
MEDDVALILFLLSLFGNLSVIRIMRFFRTRALITSSGVTKTGTGACACLQVLIISRFHNVMVTLIAMIAVIFLFSAALWMLERRQIDALKTELLSFFDHWILNLRLGESLSSARVAALTTTSRHFRALLEPLFITSSGQAPHHLLLPSKILVELKQLAISPHAALARLESLREMMRKSDDFRRRSGQAMRQTTIQSLVLVILQIALGVFTVIHYGWNRTSDLILASFLISGCGLVLMRQLARKAKWNI